MLALAKPKSYVSLEVEERVDHLHLTLVPDFPSGRTAGEASGRPDGVPGSGSNGPKHHQQADGSRLSGALCRSQQVRVEKPSRGPSLLLLLKPPPPRCPLLAGWLLWSTSWE